MPDGKPDLSGLWQPAAILIGDIAANLPPNSVPYQPWAEKLYKERRANDGRDDPTANCIVGGVPRSDAGAVSVQDPAREGSRRDPVRGGALVPADLRRRPVAARGHEPVMVRVLSRTSGTRTRSWSRPPGFNDKGWLDNFGKPATDKLRVTEKFVRKDFGHMDIVITIDDPGAYTKPWDVTLPLILRPDTELLEYICNENNKYFDILPKEGSKTP